MKFLVSKTNDPYFNLAMEEYLTKNCKETIFYLYKNTPSVIIGKNQNPHTEVGIDFIKEKGILLVRRLSGGGAVYQTLGNMNYGFIMKNKASDLYDFKKYSQPIIEVLNKLDGINIEFTGRNDLVIEGRKISGAAQYISGNHLLHHGTILYDVDFSEVGKILLPNDDKLKTKGVKSVISRVGNIKNFLKEDISFEQIQSMLLKEISSGEEFIPSEDIIKEVEKIAQDKRKSIDFILSNKKQYANQMVEYIPGFGTIEVYSNTENGLITEFEIFGEYFFKNDLTKIKDALVGVKFTKEVISDFVNSIENFGDYFHRLEKTKLIELIMGT